MSRPQFLNQQIVNNIVDATEMTRHFGKQTIFWLNNEATKRFTNELAKLRNLSLDDLVKVIKGGNNPGT